MAGKKHGIGYYKIPIGGEYSGEFFQDSITGKGTFKYLDGGKYIG